jgi:UDP-N-acetylmuramate dehydrogenase
MNAELVSELRKVAPVKLDEPMSRHTTFGVGGPADVFMSVRSEEQLRMSFAAARRSGAEVFIFGSGSNILVGDGGIRGVVIENQNSEIVGPERNGDGYKVRVGSGMSFAALARRLASNGFEGVEWACGIPGSMGGAVVTNAGAYGHSLRDVLVGTRLTDARGQVVEMTPDDLDLGYRNSAFTHGKLKDQVVLTVDLRVHEGDAKVLKERIRELDQQRRGAQPPGRNCGSVFQNPAGRSAWQYVDDVGLREHRIGNAQFSAQHSNFIQNLGGATANDVVSLIRLAQDRVREQFGVELTPEVMFVGEFV